MSDMKNASIETTETYTAFGKALGEALTVTEEIDVMIPEGHAIASLRCSAKITKNLGNYNSVSVEVSLTTPCLASQAEALYPFVEKFVTSREKAMVAAKPSEG